MNIMLTGSSVFLGRYVTAKLKRTNYVQHAISLRPLSRPDLYSVITHDFMGSDDFLGGNIQRPLDAIVHMAHAMGGSREE